MRFIFPIIATVVLAGCAAQVPNSGAGAGVGFDSLQEFQGRQQEQLAQPVPLTQGGEISEETVTTGPELPTATGTELPTIEPVEPVAEPNVAPIQLNQNNPGLSDEQNFDAVTARETIEGAAQRRAAQQQAYRVIAPTALPTRTGGSGASIVAFALSTTNVVGQGIYQRTGSGNRFQRNCAKYASSDLAQQAFLSKGGPERDRQGLDPDGDGFACFWDPAPFRQAMRN